MRFVFAVLVGLTMVGGSAQAASCFKFSKPSKPMSTAAQMVTCCCRTYNGGQCCAQVVYCGGFIPGCICS